MRYHCQNCDARFELAENDAVRCPSCFWTSSVRCLDEPQEKRSLSPKMEKVKKESLCAEKNTPLSKELAGRGRSAIRLFLLAMLLLAAAVFAAQSLRGVSRSNLFPKGTSIQPFKADVRKPALTQPKSSVTDPLAVLSGEEKSILLSRPDFSIPRKLTADESDMLTRRVDFSAEAPASPRLVFWTAEKFQDYLTAEQKKRGIHFTGSYEHALTKLFKDRYLKAEQLVNEGAYGAARLELLNSLVFPVYANDIRLHRAVGLVMLQGLIHDTLSKIKTLNAYLFKQSVEQELGDLRENYEGFFALAGKEDWNEAFAFAGRLEEKAKALEEKLKMLNVEYPPSISRIDEDIRKSLFVQEEGLLGMSTMMNSILADLRIKKTALQQNTTDSLQSVKTKYEAGLSAIGEKKWNEAKAFLEEIGYPPEIASDAKQKAAILSKLIPKTEN